MYLIKSGNQNSISSLFCLYSVCSYPQLCFVLLAKSLKLLEDQYVHLQSGCDNSKLPVVRFNYDKVFASALKTIKHRGKIQIAIITTIDLCFYIQHFNLPVMGLFAYLSDQAFCLISRAYYRTHFGHPGGLCVVSSEFFVCQSTF